MAEGGQRQWVCCNSGQGHLRASLRASSDLPEQLATKSPPRASRDTSQDDKNMPEFEPRRRPGSNPASVFFLQELAVAVIPSSAVPVLDTDTGPKDLLSASCQAAAAEAQLNLPAEYLTLRQEKPAASLATRILIREKTTILESYSLGPDCPRSPSLSLLRRNAKG